MYMYVSIYEARLSIYWYWYVFLIGYSYAIKFRLNFVTNLISLTVYTVERHPASFYYYYLIDMSGDGAGSGLTLFLGVEWSGVLLLLQVLWLAGWLTVMMWVLNCIKEEVVKWH